MSIILLDPSLPLPTPRLDKSGALTASALSTWCRMLADQSQRTTASDWRRALAAYREQLGAELARQVDRRLIDAVRQARIDRIEAEEAMRQARDAVDQEDLPAAVARLVGQPARADRRSAVERAEQMVISARLIERDARTALGRAVQPVCQEYHARAGYLVQESMRAARVLVADAKHVLHLIESVDAEALLLEGHNER